MKKAKVIGQDTVILFVFFFTPIKVILGPVDPFLNPFTGSNGTILMILVIERFAGHS
jgi:hypothetical protein